ncbi:MAG: flagellar hook-associated protein FlgL [Burkholderiales bacterium]|nr:flagellar hook-associated protein FlgL [Burkholderiales bacterium]
MRISTSMLFDAGVGAINRNQADLARTQQQLATGRRIATPADDPVASAEALNVSSAKSRYERLAENQGHARDALARTESVLGELGRVLADVRERLIAAGNGALADRDRATIALELEHRLTELVGLANSADGRGHHLFAGFRTGTQPFVTTAGGVVYNGDQGERLLQVTPERQMPVSVSGDAVFLRIPTGNGVYGVSAAPANGGTAIAYAPASAGAPSLAAAFRIDFVAAGPGVAFEIRDAATSALLVPATPYTPGTALSYAGAQVEFTGTPVAGDSFTVAPSTARSVFDTLQGLVGALRVPIAGDDAAQARLFTQLGAGLADIDQASEVALAARTAMGVRLAEVESLAIGNEDARTQFSARVSELQDTDYAAAISDLAKREMVLEAAQRSFTRVTRLTLFDFL